MKFRARDYAHVGGMYLRNKQRQRRWARRYERAIADGSFVVGSPAVVQIIPTEACNLRCGMCNQWGDNGYFRAGVRDVDHMDPDQLEALIDHISPEVSLISVHGGEPFAYKHVDRLLGTLARKPFDVMFSTNGTLLSRHVVALSEIDNLSFLLSIDGDESAHDRVRGAGRYRQAGEAVEELFARRRALGKPAPVIIMSMVVCELTGDAIEGAYHAAQEMGAFIINYNMRWFLTEDVGLAYEQHLSDALGVRSSGAWRGWLTDAADYDYGPTCDRLTALLRRKRFKLRPPFVMTTPDKLRGDDFERYFSDYLEVFGNDNCFMPYYWARVHANGELIFCPGHPDVIGGNVFRDGLHAAFNSRSAIEFRKHTLHNRMPICNRCCGLFMIDTARPAERRVRKKLGLIQPVKAHYP